MITKRYQGLAPDHAHELWVCWVEENIGFLGYEHRGNKEQSCSTFMNEPIPEILHLQLSAHYCFHSGGISGLGAG
jgi:hypothetical protein